MKLEEVPILPEDAVRNYGNPPYNYDGYVIDSEIKDRKVRWRFRGAELIGFMIYKNEEELKLDNKCIWKDAWFKGRGY